MARKQESVPAGRLDYLYHSPVRLLGAVATAVFFSDAFIMAIRAQENLRDHLVHHLLDSLMLVALLFPVLIILLLRPVKLHLEQRRRAEAELASERNKLQEILDALPAGICIVSASREITYVNAAMEREFGAVEGRSCHRYFQNWSDPCPGCRSSGAARAKANPWESMSHKNDKVYEIFETELQSSGNGARIAMVRDITARKTAEYELRASRQQLRSLSVHQQRTREEERAAISREIHDELGQVLATVQLGVSSLADENQDHEVLAGKVAAMKELLSGAIRSVQRIATDLRPAILDELGLAEAVEWQVAELQKRTPIACSAHILLPDETEISREVATAVFRILQEALTNVVRHSKASRVAVSVEQRNARLVLRVSDDGHGITAEQARGGRSLGITGMRERAYALGGRVRLCRSPKQGTVVIAHIPVGSSRGKACPS